MTAPTYEFIKELSAAMQSGRSRSIVLSGNVQDLFFKQEGDSGRYIPLLQLLLQRFTFPDQVDIGGENVKLAVIHLDLNDGIRFLGNCREKVVEAFVQWQVGLNQTNQPNVWNRRREEIEEILEQNLRDARNNTTTAIQILRRFVEASQATNGPKLFIVIEGADLVLPAGNSDLASASFPIIRKLGIIESWFRDPVFTADKHMVVMLSDSVGGIHPRITRLPQVMNIEVASPDRDARLHFVKTFYAEADKPPQTPPEKIADDTAGLSLYSIRQMLTEFVCHGKNLPIPAKAITKQLSVYIRSQLGDGVKFYRADHPLGEARGNRKFKEFAAEELIPSILTRGDDAISVVIACGPIGAGKSYLFDGIAFEVDCPVLELGNIRSQWYGGTDIILEKLERLLWSLTKVIIMMPEADTVLGGVGKDVHETERRLTGKIQSLMSNPGLMQKVTWVLDTARVDQLSPDIRRPGRADMIIPILDPDDTDRRDFVKMILSVLPTFSEADVDALMSHTKGFSAGLFGAIRKRAKRRASCGNLKTVEDLVCLVKDAMTPDIGTTRRRQELQALLNCTSRSLLPEEFQNGDIEGYRKKWLEEIKSLDH